MRSGKVNEPGGFYLLIYVQSRDISKAKRLLELLANRVVERQWVSTNLRKTKNGAIN